MMWRPTEHQLCQHLKTLCWDWCMPSAHMGMLRTGIGEPSPVHAPELMCCSQTINVGIDVPGLSW